MDQNPRKLSDEMVIALGRVGVMGLRICSSMPFGLERPIRD